MSYKNWEQILGVFKLQKQCYDGIFVNMHTLRDPWSDLLLSPTQVFFSFLFCVYHAGSRTHLSLFSSSSSFSSFLSFSCCFQGLVAIFFYIHFHWVSIPFHIVAVVDVDVAVAAIVAVVGFGVFKEQNVVVCHYGF